MARWGTQKFLFLLLSACSVQDVQAGDSPEPMAPVVVKQADGTDLLDGWKAAPAPHAKSRMVIEHEGYSTATVITIEHMPLDFTQGLKAALNKEGLDDVAVLAKQDIAGDLPAVFNRAIDNPRGRYASFTAMAKGRAGPVKIVGLWLQSPSGDDVGSTYEMFIASPDEYRALGGWFVPSAYYFTDYLTDPTNEAILEFGSHSSSEAARNLAERFGVFMRQIIHGRQLTGMMQQQTLSIQQGLDQAQGSGLQDPMYDW